MPTKTEYREYIAGPVWQERRRVFIGDHGECNSCGLPRWLAVVAYDQDLHVDHISYARVGAELDEDLQSLCKRCHEIKHFGASNLHQVLKQVCASHRTEHWGQCQECVSDRKPSPAKVPQDLGAERAVLCSIFLDNDVISTTPIKTLRAVDFFLVQHRRLFAKMIELYGAKQGVTLELLADYFTRKGDLESVGGAAYLSELLDYVSSSSNIPLNVHLIRQTAVLRSMLYECELFQEALRSPYLQDFNGQDS